MKNFVLSIVFFLLVYTVLLGQTVTQAWATFTSGANPVAINTDTSGNVYTANSGNSTISKIALDGTVTKTWNASSVVTPVCIITHASEIILK